MKVAFIPFCNEMKEFAWHHTASNWGRGEVCDTAIHAGGQCQACAWHSSQLRVPAWRCERSGRATVVLSLG